MTKKGRKIGKLLGYLLLLLLIGGGLFLTGRWALQQWEWRQLSGDLLYDENQVPAGAYPVGEFRLLWNPGNGTLSIVHNEDPARILWQSVPERSFVNAAAGQEIVTEARGSFFIEDDISSRCGDQRIDEIVPASNNLRILGSLSCGDAADFNYEIGFYEIPGLPNQLGFDLRTENPDLDRLYLTYASSGEEHFFGFGEQFSTFDLKGRRLPIFVMEQGIGRGAEPITTGANLQANAGGDWHTSYAAVPHYVSSELRSLFLETTTYAVFDMRRDDHVQIQVFGPQLTGRLLYGDSPADLILEYTSYAGRMRLLPSWILGGAVVGMQGGTDRVLTVWEELQERNTPVAAFWLQDWVGQRETTFGQQLWWNWELDRERYPRWEEMRAALADEDVRLMTYVSPFLADVGEKENADRNLFREAAALEYLVKNPEGDPYLIENTSFSAGLVDLTHPQARAWYLEVIRENVAGAGASGWMADFGEALPYDAVLHSGQSPVQYHNQYPVAWAELNREAIEGLPNSEEYVFFTRSGYTRSPGATTLFWLGDQLVSWDTHDGIKTAVTGLLSSGISGFAYNHSDIGGYTTITNPIRDYHRSQELLLRWMELNAFTTIYRTHEGNIPAENVQFYTNDATLDHFDRFARVYKAWEFYRTELALEASVIGLPVVRHLFIHYPHDPRVYEISYEQFLVGEELLVAPVLDEGAEEVEVYLPAGRWIHLWSGETYGDPSAGSEITVPAPLGQPAVFYPAGSPVGRQLLHNLRELGVVVDS